jgi:hyperosmotically inducible periplasmic protein
MKTSKKNAEMPKTAEIIFLVLLMAFAFLGAAFAEETQPDNTGINERDREENALTAQDQDQDELNLKLTQEIRQAIMADDSLSFTAKNVKIISVDGEVTLRGPVNTEAEKSAIEQHASAVAGVKRVDNQIEVIPQE